MAGHYGSSMDLKWVGTCVYGPLRLDNGIDMQKGSSTSLMHNSRMDKGIH